MDQQTIQNDWPTWSRGQGSQLWDQGDSVCLDMLAANRQSILGHSATALQKTLLDHRDSLLGTHDSGTLRADFDASLQPFTGHCVAAILPGADLAVEWAIAATRRRSGGQKFKIITLTGSYHGRTLALRSASGEPHAQENLGPLVAGFQHQPCDDAAKIAAAIDDQTAAILVQPILTHAGFDLYPDGFLKQLRRIADQQDLLFIVDETQLPIGASGQLTCSDAFDLNPDLVILASGLAGGLPIGAVLSDNNDVTDLASDPLLRCEPISTLVMSVAITTLQAIRNQGVLSHVRAQAEFLNQLIDPIASDFEFVRQFRQCGLMVSIEMELEALAVQRQLLQAGVLLGAAGPHTLLLQPALTIDQESLEHCAKCLRNVFQAWEHQATTIVGWADDDSPAESRGTEPSVSPSSREADTSDPPRPD